MHISEGVISAPVLAGGWALTALGVALGLRRLDYDRIMTVALLASVFFVASLVHVPLGPASVHLLLNGLLGLLLGWGAFPAMLAALLLQATFFQYGGFIVLGVNTLNMALPAVLAAMLCAPLLRRGGTFQAVGAFCCGALAIAGSGVMTALSLALSDQGFLAAAKLILAGHAPLMLVEGCLSLAIISFLSKVQPDMLPFMNIQTSQTS